MIDHILERLVAILNSSLRWPMTKGLHKGFGTKSRPFASAMLICYFSLTCVLKHFTTYLSKSINRNKLNTNLHVTL